MLREDERKILRECPSGTILVNLDGEAEYNATSLKEFKLKLEMDANIL